MFGRRFIFIFVTFVIRLSNCLIEVLPLMILMTSEINHIIDRMFFRYCALLKKTISELYMNCYDRTSQFCCYRKRKSLFAIMHDYFGRICYQGKESFFLCCFLLVFVFWLLGVFGTIFEVYRFTFVLFCAIWYYLYNFQNVKNAHGGVLLLVKLQAEVCNFTKSNTPQWTFFTFFKLYKWY